MTVSKKSFCKKTILLSALVPFSLLTATPVEAGLNSPEWYLPGVTPRQYQQGSKIELFVNKLNSMKTQLPYEYYTLAYCSPKEVIEQPNNLGSSFLGDVVQNTPYDIKVLENKSCTKLCDSQVLFNNTN